MPYVIQTPSGYVNKGLKTCSPSLSVRTKYWLSAIRANDTLIHVIIPRFHPMTTDYANFQIHEVSLVPQLKDALHVSVVALRPDWRNNYGS